MKPPASAERNAESATIQSRSRLGGLFRLGITGFFGSAAGLIGYGAASSIGDCAVCAASRSPETVAVYVASAAALAAFTVASRG